MFVSKRLSQCAMAAIVALAPIACSSNAGGFAQSAGNALPAREILASGSGVIKHVVIVVQENRSVDDLFQGYPGANTVSQGRNSHSGMTKLQPISLKTAYIIDHSAQAMFTACNGTERFPALTAGWMASIKSTRMAVPPIPSTHTYRTTSPSHISIWRTNSCWAIISTRRKSTKASFRISTSLPDRPRRASTSRSVPNGDATVETATRSARSIRTARSAARRRPVFDYTTLGDELDNAGLSWRFYSSPVKQPMGGYWSGYQAIKHIRYGPDWKNIVTPQRRFLKDVPNGILSSVTWITPTCEESDHTACGGGLGPSWVSSIVNTVGKSKFWDSTAIFVFWDDWGGLYDPRSTAVRRLRRIGFPHSAARHFAVRQEKLHLESTIRARQHSAIRRRPVRFAAFIRCRQTRDLAGRRLLRLHAKAADVRGDQGTARHSVSVSETRRYEAARFRITLGSKLEVNKRRGRTRPRKQLEREQRRGECARAHAQRQSAPTPVRR